MDEDTLPTASHATSSNSPGSSPLLNPRYRAKSPTSSSSPPLFSDDDPPDMADITNYESPRDKRKRAGTWWEHGLSAPKRRQFARNFDSGVYMGSDDSESAASDASSRYNFGLDGTSDLPSDPPVPESSQSSQHPTFSHGRGVVAEHRVTPMPASERFLWLATHRNLEANTAHPFYQTFDFTRLGMEDEDLHVLRQLGQIVAVPPDTGTEVPTEGQYRSMTPEITLTLEFNKLRCLHLDLFCLQNLVHLSLRNNEIEELPLQIGSLRNLVSLDVCHNRLRTLPAELLDICAPRGKLTRLVTFGNPLVEVGDLKQIDYTHVVRSLPPNVSAPHAFSAVARYHPGDLLARMFRYAEQNWSDFEGHHIHTPRASATPQAKLFLVTRTVAAYYDAGGRLLRGSPDLPMQEEATLSILIRSQPGLMVHTSLGAYNVPPTWFDRPSDSPVPSLYTSALNTAFKSYGAQEFIDWAGKDLPPQVERGFRAAESNLRTVWWPFRTCHVCGKTYVVPRAAWIEGWFFDQIIVPIKVVVCSWGCVPDVIAKRPERLQWMDVPPH